MALLSKPGKNFFVADLHHPGGPHTEIDQLFDEMPPDTKQIFLLGDTFHFWINDGRFIRDRYGEFLIRLQGYAERGIDIFFLEGNRDFLATAYLQHVLYIHHLPNPSLMEIGGRIVYIGHGDELCWSDWAYQIYKTVIRSRAIRLIADYLPRPLLTHVAQRMTEASASVVAGKPRRVLEVPHRAYRSIIESGIDVIIHGHVHDTYQREYVVGGRKGTVYAFGWKDGKRNVIYFDG